MRVWDARRRDVVRCADMGYALMGIAFSQEHLNFVVSGANQEGWEAGGRGVEVPGWWWQPCTGASGRVGSAEGCRSTAVSARAWTGVDWLAPCLSAMPSCPSFLPCQDADTKQKSHGYHLAVSGDKGQLTIMQCDTLRPLIHHQVVPSKQVSWSRAERLGADEAGGEAVSRCGDAAPASGTTGDRSAPTA